VSESFRNFFSFFSKNVPRLFFDSAATSLKPDVLIQKQQEVFAEAFEIVHRSSHDLADVATENFELVRKEIAEWLYVEKEEIIFTSGATAALNIAAMSWVERNLQVGDEILISIAEHHSSCLPWIELARKKGANVSWVYFDKTKYHFELDDFVFKPQTKVLVVSAHSNVTGPLWRSEEELAQLIARAHKNGVIVVVDGAQHAPFCGGNIKKLNPDFYAFSAHKMFGPQGVGILYVNKRIFTQLSPVFVGGGIVDSASVNQVMYKKSPSFLEVGTPPVALFLAWGEVFKKIIVPVCAGDQQRRLGLLVAYLCTFLRTIPGITILGNMELLATQGHLVSFVVDGIHAHDLAEVLNAQKVYVRAGMMCAQPLFEYLQVSACLRVSMHWYTTQAEVTALCDALRIAISQLRAL
jgi:cysteine desulfurase/selenocysteine lyase